MKTKAIISEIKRCIRCIESTSYDMCSLSDTILEIRRFLYSLDLEELGDNMKEICRSLSSGKYRTRSIVSRLETVIRELRKVESSSSCKDHTRGYSREKGGKSRNSRKAVNLSRYDVILAQNGDGYSYCVVSGIMPNDHVTAYPIVMGEAVVDADNRIAEEGMFRKAVLTGPMLVVPYKSAQNCFFGKLPYSPRLEAALNGMKCRTEPLSHSAAS